MADASSTPPVSRIDEQVLAEHRRIREVVEQVEQSPDLHDLLARLDELKRLLDGHFRLEEGPDGLYDTIRAVAPRYFGKVAALEQEHQDVLAEIDALAARARACLAGPVADVLAGAGALARRMRRHEAIEDHLLLDSLYTDLGQGD